MIENPALRSAFPAKDSVQPRSAPPLREEDPRRDSGQPEPAVSLEEALESAEEDDEQPGGELSEGLRQSLDQIPDAELLNAVDYLHGRASAALHQEIGEDREDE